MKFFKKWVVPALIAIGALSSCAEPEPLKHIGILLHGESRVPLMNGFLEEMTALGYETNKNMVITILNTNNDAKQLAPLAKQLINQNVDLLVAAGGLEAEEIKTQISATPHLKTPVLVLYINAIIERKFVTDRRNPGWNVTGIDNLNAELSGKRVELLTNLLPNAKRLLVLYHPKIEPATIGLKYAREEADKRGLQIIDRAVTSSEEIKKVMDALQPGEVDAMLLVPAVPIDNELKNVILPTTQRLKIPVMAHSRSMVKLGTLASYGAPFTELGRQGSRLAHKILTGTPASSIPFEVPVKYEYSINQSVLDALAIEMPSIVRSQVTEMIP